MPVKLKLYYLQTTNRKFPYEPSVFTARRYCNGPGCRAYSGATAMRRGRTDSGAMAMRGLTRLIKIAIQATPQMTPDKEAIGLSRVHILVFLV